MGREAQGNGMWTALAIDSVHAPRAAAQRLLASQVPAGAVIEAAILITCLGVVLGYVAMQLSAGDVDPVSRVVLGAPLFGAAIQLGLMSLVIGLTDRVGQLFGGKGDLWGAARVVVWLNGLTLAMQALQILALVALPPLAGLVALATLFWLLWAYANFTAELHGFDSPLVVLGVTILTVLGIALGLTILVRLFGLSG